MHEKLVERNFKCTLNPTFTSPSCRTEDYHLPVPTHSPTFLLPPACVLGMSRLTSIGGSMKPMPAGSSRADSGLCRYHRVLSAVHTEIVTIPLDCLVAFFKNWIFFFFSFKKLPLFPDCLRDTENRILDTSNSGTSPLTKTVVPDPRSVHRESAQSLESVQAWLLSSLL